MAKDLDSSAMFFMTEGERAFPIQSVEFAGDNIVHKKSLSVERSSKDVTLRYGARGTSEIMR